MFKQTNVHVSTAFAGVVPDIEKLKSKADATITAYEGTSGHPCLPAEKPGYMIGKLNYQVLAFAWSREWARHDTAPRRGIWICGPKGSGKTTMVEQFFARLGVPVVSKTCNRRIPLSDYFSQTVPDGAGGWMTIDGPIKIAMEMGYPVILNEPSVMDPADLIAMHDIIDRGFHVMESGEVIQAKRGFMVFATDNTGGFGDVDGSYADVNTMNQATMSRFLKLELAYMTDEEEIAVLEGLFPGQSRGTLAEFVKFANVVRSVYINKQSRITIGTRELIDWVEASIYFTSLSGLGIDPSWFALRRVVADGLPSEEFAALKQHYESVFNKKVTA